MRASLVRSGFVKGMRATVSDIISSTPEKLEIPGEAVVAYFTKRCISLGVGYFIGYMIIGHPAREFEKMTQEISEKYWGRTR